MGPVRIKDKMIQEYVENCFPKDEVKNRIKIIFKEVYMVLWYILSYYPKEKRCFIIYFGQFVVFNIMQSKV